MVGLALAVLAGATLRYLGVPFPGPLPLLALLLLPVLAFLRPAPSSPTPLPGGVPGLPARQSAVGQGGPFRTGSPVPPFAGRLLALGPAALAGFWMFHQAVMARAGDCRLHLTDGARFQAVGRLAGAVVDGRGEVLLRAPGLGGCRRPVRFVGAPELTAAWGPGSLVVLQGEWRRTALPGAPDPRASLQLSSRARWRALAGSDPLRAGYLRVEEGRAVPEASFAGDGREAVLVLRGKVQKRLEELFPRKAALVWALVLARREALEPELRESFARAGVAHLLAISGFHVGVLGGLLFLAASPWGLPHRVRYAATGLGVWAYVALIGFPHPAVRAALILTALSLGRMAGRRVVPLGALASAFLLLFLADPLAVLQPGFQLSFAGTLGLMGGGRPLRGAPGREGRGSGLQALERGLAAGVAATLATLPFVMWHFGRISLVGIPATLLAAPLVTLALPAVLGAFLLSFVHPWPAAALAAGGEGALGLLAAWVGGMAGLPFASFWVSRPALWAAAGGLGAARLFLALARGVSPSVRLGLQALGVAGGLLLQPVVEGVGGWGAVEVVALDVGQGDALAIRTPRGRWILVDAGPRSPEFDAGERVVLPYLRRRGVSSLELLILTHPDLDHMGGAPALLRGLRVRSVADPGHAVGKESFLEALEAARERGIPWRVLQGGDSLEVDGVAFRVLAPEGVGEAGGADGEGGGEGAGGRPSPGTGREEDPNDRSVVLELRYGAFAALLTGDAPVAAELGFLPRLLSPRVQVLKVAHHGSRTSTGSELLERTAPEVALVSVGRRNRFGHPHPEVLERLEGAGVRVLRTDREGTVSVKGRRDGTVEFRAGG